MVDYTTFSALRLSRIFPPDLLESYPFYTEFDPAGDFDTEYLGGQWTEEAIDGVQFWYPQTAGEKLGVVEVWGSLPVAGGCPARDRPDPSAGWLVPAWVANADRVLGALALPLRMGADEADVRALAAGRVLSSKFPNEWYKLAKVPAAKGTLSTHYFACRAPDLYHMQAVIHAAEGLLKLKIFRPDVVKANDSEGGYDACTRGMYDEGPG